MCDGDLSQRGFDIKVAEGSTQGQTESGEKRDERREEKKKRMAGKRKGRQERELVVWVRPSRTSYTRRQRSPRREGRSVAWSPTSAMEGCHANLLSRGRCSPTLVISSCLENKPRSYFSTRLKTDNITPDFQVYRNQRFPYKQTEKCTNLAICPV